MRHLSPTPSVAFDRRTAALAGALIASLAATSSPAAAGERWGAPVGLYDTSQPIERAAPRPRARRSHAGPEALPGRAREVDWRSIARANSGASGEHASLQKIGRPYQIEGVWYVPAREDNYDEVGVASWYGDAFHGKPTSNGEIFDMNAISAAHPTLPIPSMVRVTVVETGKTLDVRVNDRGPFARDRILDLSKAAAQELGVYRQGTAMVRVQYLHAAAPDAAAPRPVLAHAAPTRVAPASAPTPGYGSGRAGMARAVEPLEAVLPAAYEPPASIGGASQAPRAAVAPRAALSANAPVARARVKAGPLDRDVMYNSDGTLAHAVALERPLVAPSGLFVQVGSFRDGARAAAIADQISGPAFVQEAFVHGQVWARVMVGPWPSSEAAHEARDALAQIGYDGARVVNSN